MIRTRKKQFSDLPIPALLAILALPLLGFSVYEFFCTKHSMLLALASFMALGILLSFQFRLRRVQAETDLKRQEILESINLADAGLLKEQLAIEAILQKISNYSQLQVLTEKLGMSFSLEEASKVLGEEVEKFFGAKDATVILYLFDSRTGELGLSFSRKGKQGVPIKAKKGDIFDEWVTKNMKPLLIEDTRSDFRFYGGKAAAEQDRDVRSLMSVPLVLGHKAVGILRLDSPRERQFSTDEARLLAVVGDLAAVTLENVQLYERVEDLAIHDSLTGLFLRRYFVERLMEEMNRALRRKTDLSVLMMDLDKLKHYNDTYGHSAGDVVLKTVGMILSYMFDRPENMVCRYGGEEFSILLPDCSRAKALELAEELRKKIESQPIILRREKTHITASIGVATFPRDAQLKEELLAQADTALYHAKHKGRNRVCGVK